MERIPIIDIKNKYQAERGIEEWVKENFQTVPTLIFTCRGGFCRSRIMVIYFENKMLARGCFKNFLETKAGRRNFFGTSFEDINSTVFVDGVVICDDSSKIMFNPDDSIMIEEIRRKVPLLLITGDESDFYHFFNPEAERERSNINF